MPINHGGDRPKARISLAALFVVAAALGVGCGSVSQTGDADASGGSAGATGAAGNTPPHGTDGGAGSAGAHGGTDAGAGSAGSAGAHGETDGGADGSAPLGHCDQASDCVERSKGTCSCAQACFAKTDPVPPTPPYSCGFACPLVVLDCGCVNHQCTAGATTAATP